MRMPHQSPAVRRRVSTAHFDPELNASGCSILKKAACLAAAVSCGAVCVGSFGTACLSCVGGIVSGCGDCL